SDSNAKSLDPSSGYWAESLPALETPLCAVVDPVRDFRWHALRCGGPETAAFLCELPVPTWAIDCTVTSMPSLTVQYMSDSGAVQLSRDCGEQGTRHMSCQGKLDKDSILQQLQCAEREDDAEALATETAENNQLPAVELTPVAQQKTPLVTRQPLLPEILEHDILTVVSNNDEDNSIDVNPNQIEDTVKNVINKFNLADLMQAEQSLHSDEVDGHFDGEHLKDGKKVGGKKYSPLFEKKEKFGKKDDRKQDEDDELMMGDQPDETETQPIDIVQQAVKPTEGDSDESGSSVVAGGSTEGGSTLEESTTADSRLRRATDEESSSESTPVSTTEITPTTVTTSAPTTTTAEPTTSSTASHILPTTPKKEISSVGDHFIPPMLLVKARFTSTKTHVEPIATTELVSETTQTSESTVSTMQTSSPALTSEDVTAPGEVPSTVSELTTAKSSPLETETTVAHQIVEITFDDKELSSKIGTLSITTRPFTTVEAKTSTVSPQSTTVNNVTSTSGQSSTQPDSTVPVSPSSTLSTTTSTTTVAPTSTASSSTTTTTTTVAVPTEHELQRDEPEEEVTNHESDDELDDQQHQQHPELHNSFSNIENYQPYKPNRHRSLTKPEVHSNCGNYIKKILG
ncbi:transcription initiation factor TFIID subunit 12-like, partial [Wyeomyia smithii]|uniref:transcription initiation factor TFIID subunit 12-like n=1 Tax=Wyeomyia smithii TaxID=174621 RepID=UPI002467DD22